MDYTAAKFWFDIVQTVFLIGISIYAWLNNKHRASKETIAKTEGRLDSKIDTLDGRLNDYNDRLVSVERDIRHLPEITHIHEVHARVDEVGQGVRALEGEMKQFNHTMQLIQQHLLESKR